MKKIEKTHKLWQSMINTNLTPDEFAKLIALGRVREQSIRELTSTILRQELETFKDLITEEQRLELYNNALSLEACAVRRRVGRPRLKDARSYTKIEKEKKLPLSIEQLIEESESK